MLRVYDIWNIERTQAASRDCCCRSALSFQTRVYLVRIRAPDLPGFQAPSAEGVQVGQRAALYPLPGAQETSRDNCGERPRWVATCPWHPGFPASAIRSVDGPSSTLPRFRSVRDETCQELTFADRRLDLPRTWLSFLAHRRGAAGWCSAASARRMFDTGRALRTPDLEHGEHAAG